MTPDADWNGTVNLTYDVNDGTVTTAATGTVTVDPVNDAPTDIIPSGAMSIAEDAADGTVVATLSSQDVDVGDSHTYAIINDPSGNFEIVGNEIRVKAGATLDYETAPIAGAPTYTLQSGASDPFDGIDTGYNANPSFTDIDGDGDLDMFIGLQSGGFEFYRNTGSASEPTYSFESTNPFGLGYTEAGLSGVEFVDIDNDGDSDAFVNDFEGSTYYFENTGSATSPSYASYVTNPFGIADLGSENWASSAFGDLDGDGDLDLIAGHRDGNFYVYENTGDTSSPNFVSLSVNAYGLTDVGDISNPVLLDVDNDGDLDLVAGAQDGTLNYFENIGTASTPIFDTVQTNAFGGIDVGDYSTLSAADINNDGLMDLVIGAQDGTISYLETSGPKGYTLTVETTDSGGLTYSEVMTIAVTDVNEAPVVSGPTSFNTDEDNAIVLTEAALLANATDADGDTLSVQNLAADQGTLIDNLDGTWTLTPDPDWNGTVNLTYDVSDGTTATAATGTVTVDPINSAPTDITFTGGTVNETVVDGGTIGVAYDPSGDVVLTLSAVDADSGDGHSYAITSDPSGFFEIVSNEVRVKSGAAIDYETATSHDVTIEVTDSGGATYSEAITITVTDYEAFYTASDIGEYAMGTSEEDYLYGGAGGDSIDGGEGNDYVSGGFGDDTLGGSFGDDTLYGEDGHDDLYGYANNDEMYGDAGDDWFWATGWDTGSDGDDTLYGGTGSDLYILTGNRGDYIITDNGDGTHTLQDTVADRDGTDIVSEIEFFQFMDGTVGVADLVNVAPTDILLSNDPSVTDVVAAGEVAAVLQTVDPDVGDTHTYALTDDAGGMFDIDANTGTLTWVGIIPTPTSFTEQTGGANPFDGIDVGENSEASLVDIDNDGDLDLFVGAQDLVGGDIQFYRNTGTADSPVYTLEGGANPFGFAGADRYTKMDFVDIDNDGDQDMFLVDFTNSIKFYENVGDASSPSFAAPTVNDFGLSDMDSGGAPQITFGDLDGDGDFDILGSNVLGNFVYFENIGTASTPNYAAPTYNSFGLVNMDWWGAPELVDFDNDGDLDVLSGRNDGTIIYFENTGTADTPVFAAPETNALGGVDTSLYSTVDANDVDNDGDLDFVLGRDDGTLTYVENTTAMGGIDTSTPQTYNLTVEVSDQDSATYLENLTVYTGDSGNDSITGTSHSDIIYGLDGDDLITGGDESDFIWGGDGIDTITGGSGDDTMTGGAGQDTFVFGLSDTDGDTITDFTQGDDVLDVSAFGLTDMSGLTVTNDGMGNAMIILPSGDDIILTGIDENDMNNSDFVF